MMARKMRTLSVISRLLSFEMRLWLTLTLEPISSIPVLVSLIFPEEVAGQERGRKEKREGVE